MNCLYCPLKYIEQKGIAFHTRYTEHIQAVRSKGSNSGYASNLLNTGLTNGTIPDTVDITRTDKERKKISTLKKNHIYQVSRNNLLINDTNVDTHKPIFRTLQEMNIS